MGSNGGQEILNILDCVLGRKPVAKLYTDGRVTRLDLTVNIWEPLGDCFVFMKSVCQSKILFGAESEIESQILGSPKSNKKRLTLYNRAVEPGWGGGDEHWWRLEIVLRNLSCSVAGLCKGCWSIFKLCVSTIAICSMMTTLKKPILNRVKKLRLYSAVAFLDRNCRGEVSAQTGEIWSFPHWCASLGVQKRASFAEFPELECNDKRGCVMRWFC